MLLYLSCRNLVVRIFALNIIQNLNNRVEVDMHFFSRGEKHFTPFETRISADVM